MIPRAAASVLLLAIAACNGRDETETVLPDTQPGEEQPARVDDAVPVNPDTVSFIREGRTLHFGGREWMLAGDPVLRPIVRHVGTAEGIELYRTVSDQITATTLFFYLGNGRWQALEEAGSPINIPGEAPQGTPPLGTQPGAQPPGTQPPR